MKFSLYGMPCAGKTTLMEGLKIPVIRGSAELNKMASGKFSELSEKEKNKLRIKYAEQLSERKDSFISDGHYAFPDGVVFTDADAKLMMFSYIFTVNRRRFASGLNVPPKMHGLRGFLPSI